MKTTAMVLAATLACVGCKKNGGDAKPDDRSAVAPAVTSPAIDTLLAAVPGNAVAIGFVDLNVAPWQYITGGAGFPLDAQTKATLDKELREYIDRFVGVDVSKLQYALGFAVLAKPPTGAVLLETVAGTPKFPGATDYEGGKVWLVDPGEGITLATKGTTVIVGKDDAVRAVLETMAHKKQPITVENKQLVEWLKAETKGAAVAFAAAIPASFPLPPPVAGLSRVAASVSRAQVRAVIEGEDAAITKLQGLIDQGFATMLGQLQSAHDAAVSGQLPPPEGLGAIIGHAYAKSYTAMIKPKREGNRLVSTIALANAGTETMMMVSTIGILAAVAIPAFMDYMKKSKKTEASLHLRKLGKNLEMVYAMNSAFPKGEVALTPAAPCCQNPGGKCAPWAEKQPTWEELDFAIDEPHLFQYSYKSDGTTAVIEAVGDLDCDGIAITYRLDANGNGGQPTVTITEPAPNSD